jgi:hypothetical protein
VLRKLTDDAAKFLGDKVHGCPYMKHVAVAVRLSCSHVLPAAAAKNAAKVLWR